MWTTLDEQRLYLPAARRRTIAAQLARLGLAPRAANAANAAALSGTLRRLTRFASESGVLESARSGRIYPVFTTPETRRPIELVTRPTGRALELLAVSPAPNGPEFASPPPTVSGAATLQWDAPVNLTQAQAALTLDPNAVYVLEGPSGVPYYIGRAGQGTTRLQDHVADIRRHSRAFGLTPHQAQARVRVRVGHIQPGSALTPAEIERILIRRGNKALRGRLTNATSTGPVRVPANQDVIVRHTGTVPRQVADWRRRDRSLQIRGGAQGRLYELR